MYLKKAPRSMPFTSKSGNPLLHDDTAARVREFIDALHRRFPLEILFDCLPAVIFFVKDRECRFVCINDTLLANSGRTDKSEVLGKTDLDFFPPDLARIHMEQDRKVMKTGVALRDQLELVRNHTNHIGWHLTCKFPLFGKDGEVIGLVGICRNLYTAVEKAAPYPALMQVVAEIQERFQEPLRVAELAERSGISESSMESQFKKVFGVSPSQFIQKTRVEHAAKLLTTTGLSLSEIAQRSGFYDQSAFSKKFKETTKRSPGAYRKLFGKELS